MATNLLDLPNELLLQSLSNLTTVDLLSLTTISRRIHALITRLLYTRIYKAADLADHTLLLECYHPSQKLTEPPLFCSYLGTPSLDLSALADSEDGTNDSPIRHLDALRNLYSTYRPFRRTVSRRRHPAGDIPGSRTHTATTDNAGPSPSSTSQAETGIESEAVRQTFSLEGHEMFTQLCCSCNLVLVGPRNGLFRSFVEIKEGVVRVWKHFLEGMAHQSSRGKERQLPDSICGTIKDDQQIVWVDLNKHVGIRVKVKQRKWIRDMPVIINAEEEISVYEIEYQGKLSRATMIMASSFRRLTTSI